MNGNGEKVDGKKVKHNWRIEESKMEAKSEIKFLMRVFRNGDVNEK